MEGGNTTDLLQALQARMEAILAPQQSWQFGQALLDVGPDAGEGLGRQGYQERADREETLAPSSSQHRSEGMSY